LAFRTARAAEPKKGGRFRLGVAGANINDMHDPATWGTSAIVNIGLWGAVYNNLMEVAPDGALVPELAAIGGACGGCPHLGVQAARAASRFTTARRSMPTTWSPRSTTIADPDSQSAAKSIVAPIVACAPRTS
jgi:hypothetical protein